MVVFYMSVIISRNALSLDCIFQAFSDNKLSLNQHPTLLIVACLISVITFYHHLLHLVIIYKWGYNGAITKEKAMKLMTFKMLHHVASEDDVG